MVRRSSQIYLTQRYAKETDKKSMANKQSAIKHLRQTVKRQARNLAVKDELKRTLKTTRRIADKTSEEATTQLRTTLKMIDKAAKKKVMKKNTAARTKSRLMKLWNKA